MKKNLCQEAVGARPEIVDSQLSDLKPQSDFFPSTFPSRHRLNK